MMTENDYRHFVCIVAGDNPEELLKEYDKNNLKEPYIKYKFKDAKILHERYIDVYKAMLDNVKNNNDGNTDIELIEDTILDLEDMSDLEFYQDLTKGLKYDSEGNALTTENENGKFSFSQVGKLYSIPFLTKDGREVYQSKNSDIYWKKMHLSGGEIYGRAWEMVMEGSQPNTDYESIIYENMKDKMGYFNKFETKENYIISNTAFWGYAFLSEKTGWVDADGVKDQFIWMAEYYNMFIKNLPDDTLLTIYECKK